MQFIILRGLQRVNIRRSCQERINLTLIITYLISLNIKSLCRAAISTRHSVVVKDPATICTVGLQTLDHPLPTFGVKANEYFLHTWQSMSLAISNNNALNIRKSHLACCAYRHQGWRTPSFTGWRINSFWLRNFSVMLLCVCVSLTNAEPLCCWRCWHMVQ